VEHHCQRHTARGRSTRSSPRKMTAPPRAGIRRKTADSNARISALSQWCTVS